MSPDDPSRGGNSLPGGDDGPIGRVPHGEEAWALVDAVLEGRATAADRRRLEQLAVAHPAIARLCLRTVHLSCGIRLHTLKDGLTEELLRDTLGPGDGGPDEHVWPPAVRAADETGDLGAGHPLPAFPRPNPPRAGQLRRAQPSQGPWIRRAAGAAVAAAITVALVVWTRPPHRAPMATDAPPGGVATAGGASDSAISSPAVKADAVVSATAAGVIDGEAAEPGRPLPSGRSVRLTRGAVELAFARGATVVVTAPAQFRVTDQGGLALETGSIAAHVPSEAVGFQVQAPGLLVVDRGTNFGVRTVDGGAGTEAVVFDGAVEAVGTDAGKRRVSEPVRLTAHQAVRRDVMSTEPRPVPVTFAPEQYARDIGRVRVPLPLHGTGEGVTRGAPDPAWQVVAVPNDPGWSPRPARVVSASPKPYARFPGRSWVSLSEDSADVATGDYVFRTVIDLTGYDPDTVQLTAQAVADNLIVEVRTNGTSTAVQKADPLKVNAYLLDLSNLTLKSGRNEVDVVVRNTAERGEKSSPTALSLQWTGTACPLVRR